MNSSKQRDKAYKLMREVRLIAENLGCNVTDNDFSILDKIDEICEVDQNEMDDYDPTPYCSHCNAKNEKNCNCGPIAENN